MILEYITQPEPGLLVANFAVGKSSLKSNLKKHPVWPQLINAVSEKGSVWSIWGLSDCEGGNALNTSLRQQRADALRAVLPPGAAAHIGAVKPASLDDCITDNANRVARTWNRAALITPEQREIIFEEDDVIKGKRPVPKPVDQPTSDCSTSQKKEVAQSLPIAIDMARTALFALRDHKDPVVKGILRKYFNDDSEQTFQKAHDGLLNTLQGLRSDITLECESKGSWFYEHFCSSSSTVVTVAYVRSWLIALHVHLCEAAFGTGDLDLARTLVHEFNHLFHHTSDKQYCYGGKCSSLDPKDAYDNADSYARFAHDAYLEKH